MVFGIKEEHVIAVVLTIVACMVDVVGYAAPYWYYNDSGIITVNFGIWQYCTSVPNSTCVDLPNIETWQVAVQSVETVGIIFLFSALLILFPKIFFCERSDLMSYIVTFLHAFAALFILIGVIIYGTMAPSDWIDNIYFSFGFVIAAAGISIITVIFMCL